MDNPEITFERDTKSKIYSWYDSDRKLHRDNDQPALIKELFHTTIHMYYNHGEKCRIDGGPNVVCYYPSGELQSERYTGKYCLPEDGSPSYVAYYKNGNVGKKYWWDGKLLIENYEYYENGSLREESLCNITNGICHKYYYPNGEICEVHRKLNGKYSDIGDAPAKCRFSKTGKLIEVEHFLDGKLHYDYGPAQREICGLTGKRITKHYWINGKQVSKKTLSRWKKYINGEN